MIFRVLQLVTYDEDEWSGDNLMVLRKSAATIDTKMEPVLDFLRDPKSKQGKSKSKQITYVK